MDRGRHRTGALGCATLVLALLGASGCSSADDAPRCAKTTEVTACALAESWEMLPVGPPAVNFVPSHVVDVEGDLFAEVPTEDPVSMGFPSNVWRLKEGARSWQQVDAVGPIDSAHLYFGADLATDTCGRIFSVGTLCKSCGLDPCCSSNGLVRESDDRGDTWKTIFETPMSLLRIVSGGDAIYVSGKAGGLRSFDNGKNWEKTPPGTEHASLVVRNDGMALAANPDGGLWRGDQGDSFWTPIRQSSGVVVGTDGEHVYSARLDDPGWAVDASLDAEDWSASDSFTPATSPTGCIDTKPAVPFGIAATPRGEVVVAAEIQECAESLVVFRHSKNFGRKWSTIPPGVFSVEVVDGPGPFSVAHDGSILLTGLRKNSSSNIWRLPCKP